MSIDSKMLREESSTELAFIIHRTATISCETPSQVINNKNYDTRTHNTDLFLLNGSSFCCRKTGKYY